MAIKKIAKLFVALGIAAASATIGIKKLSTVLELDAAVEEDHDYPTT